MVCNVLDFPSFLRLNTTLLRFMERAVYSFVCLWTLGLFPPLGSCEKRCREHGVQVSVRISAFGSFGCLYPEMGPLDPTATLWNPIF